MITGIDTPALPVEQKQECAFCGIPASAAKVLFAGDHVMICDGCVIICVESMRDRVAQLLAEAKKP